MQYQEFRPVESLARYVKCFWVLEGAAAGSPDQERILPDGCTEIVFQLADPFKQYNSDGAVDCQPPAMLVGQMRRHLLIQPTGKVHVLGVRFWPGGAYPFLRLPQYEIADRVVALEAVLGGVAEELHSNVADAATAATAAASAAQVEKFLLSRLNQFRHHDEGALKAIDLILRTGGCLSIDTLAQKIGVNSRRLDRTFNTRVGLPPKTLCRIVRFQQVFKKIERQKRPDWAQIALECGYYDQPHFIKEFRAFAGKEPTSYLAEQNAMSDHFTASV